MLLVTPQALATALSDQFSGFVFVKPVFRKALSHYTENTKPMNDKAHKHIQHKTHTTVEDAWNGKGRKEFWLSQL